jgi:Zn finger protein HypA/HybF involved in hydrogenase expression
MKSKVSINIETFLLEETKQNNINISQTAEEALRSKLAILKGDSTKIDKRLLLIQIEKLSSKVNKYSAELSALRGQLTNIEKIENDAKEQQLQEEKEEIEKQTKCPNCHHLVEEDKKIEVKEGVFLCRTCSHNKEVVHKYLKK